MPRVILLSCCPTCLEYAVAWCLVERSPLAIYIILLQLHISNSQVVLQTFQGKSILGKMSHFGSEFATGFEPPTWSSRDVFTVLWLFQTSKTFLNWINLFPHGLPSSVTICDLPFPKNGDLHLGRVCQLEIVALKSHWFPRKKWVRRFLVVHRWKQIRVTDYDCAVAFCRKQKQGRPSYTLIDSASEVDEYHYLIYTHSNISYLFLSAL